MSEENWKEWDKEEARTARNLPSLLVTLQVLNMQEMTIS
jgi:hypothetical protein